MKVLLTDDCLIAIFCKMCMSRSSIQNGNTFGVMAQDGDTVRTLSVHETQDEAKTFVNTLGKKLMDVEFQDVIDMTE